LSSAAVLGLAFVVSFGAPVAGGSGKRTGCKPLCRVELVNGCCPAEPDQTPLPPGGCADFASCAAACERGEAVSCARAGVLTQKPGAGGDRDDARAWIYFDRGCRLRDGRSCWLGYTGFRQAYHGTPNLEAAVKSDQVACNTGDPNACRKLATLHHGDGRYAGLEQRACDLGSAEACATLAQAYMTPAGQQFGEDNRRIGIGPAASAPPGRINTLVQRACTLGRVESCVTVASWTFHDPSRGRLPERWKRTAALLEPFCNRGEGRACRALGELHEELARQPDKPPGLDAELGTRLYDHACALRDAEGCRLYGVAILRGQRFAGDMTHAEVILNQSCSLGSGRGCVAASQITHDKPRAQYLIDRACELDQRGIKGRIYSNAGMPELPQPLGCGGGKNSRRPGGVH
jgi:TPR repeat protein